MHIHEFYHPEYDDGYQALIVCCGLSEFCSNLTEEQWQKIIHIKKWKKKLDKELEDINEELQILLQRHRIISPEFIPSPYTIFERVKDQVSLSGKPKPKTVKSKYYFMKQFQDEFNLKKDHYNLFNIDFGHGLYTGAGNIWAARDFWHLLFTDEGKWRLFTILFLKRQLPLFILEEKLIKNFKGKNYIYYIRKSFLKRISDMIFGIKKVKIKKKSEVL